MERKMDFVLVVFDMPEQHKAVVVQESEVARLAVVRVQSEVYLVWNAERFSTFGPVNSFVE